ncbi:MAG: glycoside hydrolase family 15 protein [Rhodothermales bacterium]|nr:glycoside hydrolase family 15 protein [Rhodothermales bacterium]
MSEPYDDELIDLDAHREPRFTFDPAEPPAFKPLDAYGAIGDGRTSALVGADGSVDWACLPDFDSPSVFGALLDPAAGRFAVRPAGRFAAFQRYERGTNVLVTEFFTPAGRLRVRDFMSYSIRKGPTPEIYRRVEAVSGKVDLEVVFEPRFDYGLTMPSFETSDYGVRATAGDERSLVLSTELAMAIEDGRAVGRATLEAGQDTYVVADWGAAQVHPISSYQCARRLWQVRTFWRNWVDRLHYHGRYRDAMERSLLLLKLLIYEPTGAIVAAPTTSLPEWPGGGRNWDYRYSWVRDSAFILRALFQAGYLDEGSRYLDWLLGQTLEGGPLQVMYGIRGERYLPERELALRGYRDSRPVRIGNGAVHQFQLDIYGSLLDAALRYDRMGGILTIAEWEQLCALAQEIADRWREPDAGIWEARNEPRHYTYSKVWAWVGLTRAAELSRQMSADAPTERWQREAEAIRAEVMEKAWNPDAGAFTQYYGGTALDASVLVMPSVGFVHAGDARFQQTIEAVVEGLAAGPYPLLYRYLSEDGVGGPEGAFLLPSFWLVEALALAGDFRRARATLGGLIRHMSPLGLYSEEIHPEDESLLGNFPQGFSHLGLVNAVFRLEELARMREGW